MDKSEYVFPIRASGWMKQSIPKPVPKHSRVLPKKRWIFSNMIKLHSEAPKPQYPEYPEFSVRTISKLGTKMGVRLASGRFRCARILFVMFLSMNRHGCDDSAIWARHRAQLRHTLNTLKIQGTAKIQGIYKVWGQTKKFGFPAGLGGKSTGKRHERVRSCSRFTVGVGHYICNSRFRQP